MKFFTQFQQLQCKTQLHFFGAVAANCAELNSVDYKITAAYELQASHIEEMKQQLIELWHSSNSAFEWKDVYFMFMRFAR